MASIISTSRRTLILLSFLLIACHTSTALIPYTRSLLDSILSSDDPFRILEQNPLNLARESPLELPLLARADWRETASEHVISVDVPGLKKEEVKIEVEENRVVRIAGERKGDEEVAGEKWHRAERTNGKFMRQFRMPGNTDLDGIKARMENGVLRIVIPKLMDDKKRSPKVITIAEDEDRNAASAQDIKPNRAVAM